MTSASATTTLDPVVILSSLRDHGVTAVSGVPCSHFGAVIRELEQTPTWGYTPATNEGEAVAFAAGAALAGGLGAVFMQNSGLGNAVNPLSSLAQPLGTEMLVFVSWRGEPGREDEPQHELMGAITPALLDLLEIPHRILPAEAAAAEEVLGWAAREALKRRGPVAILTRAGTIAKATTVESDDSSAPRRAQVLSRLMSGLDPSVVVLATTGFTARELERDWDRPTNVYVIGSMGCASTVALGVAVQRPERDVVVIDGDGAAMMRLEALASIGRVHPPRLTHVLLDNGSYESTGGQHSGSAHVDFPAIALACGYRQATSVDSLDDFQMVLDRSLSADGPSLIRVPISSGAPLGLSRPRRSPRESSRRFREVLVHG